MKRKLITAFCLIAILQIPMTASAGEKPPKEDCVQPSCDKPDINEDSDCGVAWRKYENCRVSYGTGSSDNEQN